MNQKEIFVSDTAKDYIKLLRAEFEEEVGEIGRLIIHGASGRMKAKKHITRASELAVILYELRHGEPA